MAAESLPSLPCACASLRRAARAVTRSYEGALRPTGLKATQFTLLQTLELTGPSPQVALGDMLALDSTRQFLTAYINIYQALSSAYQALNNAHQVLNSAIVESVTVL